MPLAAIIFDFDGVIANSEPLHFGAFRDEVAARGIALTETAYYTRYLGFDDAGAFRAIATDHAQQWSDREIAAMVASKAQRIDALEAHMSVLFPGAAAAIRRAAATVPIGIASGALTAEIVRTLTREQMVQYFTVIVGADQTAASKPAPDPYLRAVERMSLAIHSSLQPSDCVAIEDSHWGLESARRAGLRTIGVAHTYDAESLTGADFVIQRIEDLDLDRISTLLTP